MGRGSRTAANTTAQPRSSVLSREDYRRGNCDAFALSVYKMTGWPILKIAASANDGAWHFMIEHPSGQVIDAYGIREIDEVLAEHDYEELPPADCFEASFDELIHYRQDTNERAINANRFVEDMLLN